MKKSFTLTEIVTVLVVIGIGLSLFYSVFLLNWSSLDREVARINLWQDANKVIDRISFEGRVARNISFINSKSVTFSFLEVATAPVTYTITPGGEFQRSQGVATSTLSQNIDYANSLFEVTTGGSLEVTLTLQEDVFGKRIEVKTYTEILPRNRT